MDTDLLRGLVKYSELIAAIFASVYYYKFNSKHIKYFIIMLWYIVLVEWGIHFLKLFNIRALFFYKENPDQAYNLWLYNQLIFVITVTFYYVYYKVIKSVLFKKAIKLFSIIYIGSFIINYLFFQSFIWESTKIPKVMGYIFIVICGIFYFIEILSSEKIIIFKKRLMFWVTTGAILYFAGVTPFILKKNIYMLFEGVHWLYNINTFLAVIMYLLIAFGFFYSEQE